MMIFELFFLVIICAYVFRGSDASGCSYPSPADSFTNEAYEGVWFEIGKIQTFGGSIFEKDCVCTTLVISEKNATAGEYYADNDCRDKTVDGPWTNVTGLLYNEDFSTPGRWLEKLDYGSVNYTVISIGDDYAVEYDCTTSSLGVTNYCIHVMSRTRTMDTDLFTELIDYAEGLGLNPQNLPVVMTTQEGC